VCAHAVRVAMKRVPGVTDVQVSLQSATTTIELAERNTVTLDHVRDIIRKNGFKPGAAQIKGSGTLVEETGRLVIDLRPAPARLPVAFANDTIASDARAAAKSGSSSVEVSGSFDEHGVLTIKELKRR
jgi:copper chaperone CopZ